MRFKTRRDAVFIIISSILQMFAAAAITLVPTIMPILHNGSQNIAQTVGMYVAFIYATAAASSWLCAREAVQKRRASAYFIAAICCSLGVLFSLGVEGVGLLASAMCIGLGYGVLSPMGAQLTSGMTVRRRGMILSLRQAGVPAASMVAGSLFPVMYYYIGLKALVVLLALCIALTGYVGMSFLPRDRSLPTVITKSKNALPRIVWVMAFSGAVLAGLQISIQSFLMTYLIVEQQVSVSASSISLILFGAGGVCFRIIFGTLSDMVKKTNLIVAFSSAIGGISLFLLANFLPLLNNNTALWTVCFAAGACAYGWNGVFLKLLSNVVPKAEYGSAFGYVTSAINIGAIIMPSIFYMLYRYANGLSSSLYFASGTYVAIAVSIIWFISALESCQIPQRESRASEPAS